MESNPFQAEVLVKKLLHKSDQDLEKCIEIVVTHQPEIRNCIDGSQTNQGQGIRSKWMLLIEYIYLEIHLI